MKTKTLFLSLLVLLTSMSAMAYEYTDANGTIWNFTFSGGKTSLYAGFNTPCIGGIIPADLSIPSTIEYGGYTYTVTSIGNSAFYGCSSLASITLPEGVTSIGNSAFYGCSSLASITIPDGVTSIEGYAFYNCSSLASITLPDGVTSIGNSAFSNCSSLASITLPDGVTSIGESAFRNCSSLASITIPEDVTSIGNSAFSNCSSLVSITIPESVTTIGDNAFGGCRSLASITIPESVTNIGSNIVASGTLITFTSTTVPTIGNITSGTVIVIKVPEAALEDYRSVPELANHVSRIIPDNPTLNDRTVTITAKEDGYGIHEAIPESVEQYVVNLKISGTINGYDLMVLNKKMPCLLTLDLSDAHIVANPFTYYSSYHSENNVLGAYAFYQNQTLRSVKLPETITSIGDCAFYSCRQLRHVDIPSSVKRIGNSAFKNCILSELTLPDDLETIDLSAFAVEVVNSWSCVKEIVIPNKVKRIPISAFTGNKSLERVTFPNQLESIERYAFQGCSSLSEIVLPGSLKSVEQGAFDGCTGIKKVYTEIIYPFVLQETSFPSTVYLNATLYIPHTSHDLYYSNMGWSRFLTLEDYVPSIVNCYIDNDYVLEDEAGYRLEGDGDDNPNMEMNSGSGLIVEGAENQPFDDLDIYHNGTDGASLITDGNVTADHLRFHISVTGGRWYFFCFPFDIKFVNIVAPGRSVWRHYNGNDRAVNGQGGWKNVETVDLKAGKGYIFQCDQSGTLDLTIDPEAYGNFAKQNANITLETHAAANPQNASWNFVGNPYLSYYQLEDVGKNNNIQNVFSTPITVWNGTQYVAYRPGDDDYQLKPFEAFFVQKTENDNSMTFDGNDKMTHTQGQERAAQARARRAASRVNPDRLLVDITLTGADENIEPDRTRVVFNAKASEAYEVGTDASKFMTTGVPQLWTSDGGQTLYAINERPAPEAGVEMGFYAPQTGTYTLKGKRMDTEVTLVDNYTGEAVVLTADGYTFLSEKGTFADRFVILLGNTTNVRNALMTEDAGAEYYNVAGQRIDGADTKGIVIKQADGKAAKNLGR